MPNSILLIFALLITAFAGLMVYLYSRYLRWPVYQWSQRLHQHHAEIHHQHHRDLATWNAKLSEKQTLYEECLRTHLLSIPVIQLIDFTGIGPATIDRLRESNYPTLADCQRANFDHVPGIGPVRARDIRAAVKQLTKQARAQFDAGACPLAVHFRQLLAKLDESQSPEDRVLEAQIEANNQTLLELDGLLQLTKRISFWTFLFADAVPGITEELLYKPFPQPQKMSSLSVAPRPAQPIPITHVVIRPPVASQVAKPVAPAFIIPATNRPAEVQPPDLFAAHLQQPKQTSSEPRDEHPGLPKLRTGIRFGLMIAKADGRISRTERSIIRSFLEKNFGHEHMLVRHFDPLMERTEAAIPDESTILAEIRAVLPPTEWPELLALAERLTEASGERNQKKHDVLTRLKVQLGVSTLSPATPVLAEPRINSDKVMSPDPVPEQLQPEPRSLLEIPPEAELSVELIRRRYTFLAEKLDPSKVASLGAEVLAIVNEKREKLRRAAESLIQPFGVPLEKPDEPLPPTDIRHNPDLDDVFGA